MRFHIIGVPHTVTNKEYVACAFTQKVWKFGKMMIDRGHEIIHYGHPDSDVPCTEHVDVISNKDLQKAYGSYDWRKEFFKYDLKDHAYTTFFRNAIAEIGKRKQPQDFLLPFWGAGHKPICDAHKDMIVVEPGIGYGGGHFAPYKVFESYAVYHAYCGLSRVAKCNQQWYDVVIPNYFDLDDFEYQGEKEDYFLFIGRVYPGKGVNIAVDMAKEMGLHLKVAGQGSLEEMGYKDLPDNIEVVGYAGVEERKQLMGKAKAAILPSMYVEPFGGVQIECMLSGTPTITTDWGAFAENNIQGMTGYRCRTFNHFLWAAENIDKIHPPVCRKWGEQFSLENIAPRYEEYFQNVLDLYTPAGWYARRPVENLDNVVRPDFGRLQ